MSLDIKELAESICNIEMLCYDLNKSNEGFEKFGIPFDHSAGRTIMKYNYILICAFEDELNIINRHCKNNQKVRDIMYSINPIRKFLRSYDGIRIARNMYLAHYNRDFNGNFVPWWKSLKLGKLPQTHEELIAIITFLECIRGFFMTNFYNDVSALMNNYKLEQDVYQQSRKAKDLSDLNGFTIEGINDEVERRCEERNVKISLAFVPKSTD